MTDRAHRCGTCRYFIPSGYLRQHGECRRYPPTGQPGCQAAWYHPDVDARGLCGEFEHADSSPCDGFARRREELAKAYGAT